MTDTVCRQPLCAAIGAVSRMYDTMIWNNERNGNHEREREAH